jgi:hypothetical protein
MRSVFTGLAFTALSFSCVFAADVNRKRDVIFYQNDVTPVLWPKSMPYSPSGIINGFGRTMDALAKKALEESIVKPDTFVYVPMPNFANISAVIPSNEPQLAQPSGSSWLRGIKNAMPEIKKMGKDKDPISTMSAWARKNKKEFFVGLCVNETFLQHGYNPLKPPSPPTTPFLIDNYQFNSFKAKHLNWLMGSQKDTPPLKGLKSNYPSFGSWCQVDYEQPEVRAKFSAIAKEIIKGYDIDGVLIDFCRSPILFRSVAWGGTASAAQCQSITAMLGEISAAAKAKGCLIAVRVPDSQPACKDAGMDVVAWCTAKYVDLLFFGGKAELNRWSESAEFAKKCGVPFYASIDTSRIYSTNDEGGREDDQRMPRQCQEVYRARVTEARLAGAKGIMYASGRDEWWDSYFVNYTNPKLFQPEQEKIRLENKRYLVNYRHSPRFVKDVAKYSPIFRQTLTTLRPKEIKGTAKYEIFVWDNFDQLKKERITPKCYLTTIIEIPSGWNVAVNLNGKPLKLIKKRAGSQIYQIPPGLTEFGRNEIVLSVSGANKRGLVPRIGNIGIDVVFKDELEALKKPGNIVFANQPQKKGSAAPAAVKKGGKK